MTIFKRFAFWLPLLAIIYYIYELTVNPIKDLIFAIDPLLTILVKVLGHIAYDYENSKILIPGFLVHFFLWLIYGIILDYILPKVV